MGVIWCDMPFRLILMLVDDSLLCPCNLCCLHQAEAAEVHSWSHCNQSAGFDISYHYLIGWCKDSDREQGIAFQQLECFTQLVLGLVRSHSLGD